MSRSAQDWTTQRKYLFAVRTSIYGARKILMDDYSPWHEDDHDIATDAEEKLKDALSIVNQLIGNATHEWMLEDTPT